MKYKGLILFIFLTLLYPSAYSLSIEDFIYNQDLYNSDNYTESIFCPKGTLKILGAKNNYPNSRHEVCLVNNENTVFFIDVKLNNPRALPTSDDFIIQKDIILFPLDEILINENSNNADKKVPLFILDEREFVPEFNDSIEIWNGFTNTMTKEAFLQHAKEVLKATFISKENYKTFELSHDYKENPVCTLVAINSPLPQYSHSENENISAYFYYGRLYAIKIHWSLNSTELKKQIEKQWGKPIKVKISKNWTPSHFPQDFYLWQTNYLFKYLEGNEIYYIDKNIRNCWIKDYDTKTERAKMEEEKNKKEKERRETEEREELLKSIYFPISEKELWYEIFDGMDYNECYNYLVRKYGQECIKIDKGYFSSYITENNLNFRPDIIKVHKDINSFYLNVFNNPNDDNPKVYYELEVELFNNKVFAVEIRWYIGIDDLTTLTLKAWNITQPKKQEKIYELKLEDKIIHLSGNESISRIEFIGQKTLCEIQNFLNDQNEKAKHPNF